jgi:hypothetical protein
LRVVVLRLAVVKVDAEALLVSPVRFVWLRVLAMLAMVVALFPAALSRWWLRLLRATRTAKSVF